MRVVKKMNFNSNKPVGATGTITKISHIMRSFKKYKEKGLFLSVDYEYGSEDPMDHFKKYGYMVIQNLWDPKELYSQVPKERGQINYYGSLDKFSHNNEESKVQGYLTRYAYPQYKEIYSKIRLILEDILGEKLYNTYYYDRFYFKGQRLVRNVNPDACEISVSIQISTNRFKPWPLCLQTLEGKEIATHAMDGWGILYMGREIENWRDPLESRYSKFGKLLNLITFKSDDTYHHQVVFNYVRANGPYANNDMK